MPNLWRKPKVSLSPPSGNSRRIAGGPVFDLTVLQGMVTAAEMSENEVWVATDRCAQDLENERWGYDDVLKMLASLQAADFNKAEWCQVKGGQFYPCDVYRLHFDFERYARNARGLEVYLKFSVTDEGQLSLVLVSCHGSR